MSRTLYILCTTCKKYIWVGQSNHLYCDPEFSRDSAGKEQMDRLTKFLLYEHFTSFSCYGKKHELVFTDSHGTDVLIDLNEWQQYDEVAQSGPLPDFHPNRERNVGKRIAPRTLGDK